MKKHIMFQPFFVNIKLLEGIYFACRKFDMQLSIFQPGMTKNDMHNINSVDGLLTNSLEYVETIRSKGGKAVCYSNLLHQTELAKFDACVATDEEEVGRIGVEYFLRKGFWNFACSIDTLRQQIFCENLQEAEQKSIHCFDPKSVTKSGNMARRIDFLKKLPKPCAFFVQTVHYWEYWYEAVSRAGLKVPEDLAIVTIDDLEYICNLSAPTLSSIDTSNFEQGYRMCEVLSKLLDHEEVEPMTLIAPQPQVVERESSDFYPVRNEKLHRIIRFSREHISERLTVGDLAKKFSLSMPALYQLFERHLRISPKRFLIELQLKRAKYLLTTGNSKMEVVAAESGFTSLDSFFHFFREYHNITPKEWCCRIR